LPTRNKFIYF